MAVAATTNPVRTTHAHAPSLDSARPVLLRGLVGGTWRPVGELARIAGVGVAVASAELESLVVRGVLVRRGGRHPYYALAVEAARTALPGTGPASATPVTPAPTRDSALREARTCYGHLAGRLGVALCGSWLHRDWVRADGEDFRLTRPAVAALVEAGWSRLAAESLLALAGRPCVDWTERRLHVGGALGKAITQGMFATGWLRRIDGTRAVAPTAEGRRRLALLGAGVPLRD